MTPRTSFTLTGGSVLIDGALEAVDLVVEDGVIADIAASGGSRSPASHVDIVAIDDAIVAPGFIDTQCNGAVGHDLTADPQTLCTIARALPRWGVTSFLPTVITATETTRSAAISTLDEFASAPLPAPEPASTPSPSPSPSPSPAPASTPASASIPADPIGLHFEGPAISPDRLGTHDAALRSSVDLDEVDRWGASGRVRLVTLAPELAGADELIGRLRSAGITVALGHSDASAAQACDAFERGARGVTHLFNAMSSLGHREPGVVGAALDDDRIFAGLICDGIHVDPTVVRIAWKVLGPERTVLVTDGTAAMGMADGDYSIGPARISRRGNAVRNDDGTLAGSALTMLDAIENLIDITACPIAEALTAASPTPARYLGLTDRGAIDIGRRADLVVLRRRASESVVPDARPDRLEVVATYIEGVRAWKS